MLLVVLLWLLRFFAVVMMLITVIIFVALIAHVVTQRAACTAANGCAYQASGVATHLLANHVTASGA